MSENQLPSSTKVLIVGAGPTGLALANRLQRDGVDHVVIDALEAGLNTSRAAVVHAHTLEMLEWIGAAGPLRASGIELSHFTIRDRDRRLLDVDFGLLPPAFRTLLMVPQSTTEALLETQLAAAGGRIHRGVSATRVEADGEGATVRVRTRQGEAEIKARYVVGADGMHSLVREAAGIEFAGEAYGESFVLADVRMDWPLGANEVSLFFSPAGLVVVAPLPDGSFRVVATLAGAPGTPGIGDIQGLLDARGPRSAPCKVRELIWGSRFRVHHRLAGAYRCGPFVLMGDAAHVHSPAGGQGMNAGLVDSIVLGEALVHVVRGDAPDALLDDYAMLRRPAAQEVLALASRLTGIATIRSAPLRALRNLALRLLNRLPSFKRKLAMNLSGLSRRHYSVLATGEPVPARPSSTRNVLGTRAFSWKKHVPQWPITGQ